jgi:hypothetical protein
VKRESEEMKMHLAEGLVTQATFVCISTRDPLPGAQLKLVEYFFNKPQAMSLKKSIFTRKASLITAQNISALTQPTSPRFRLADDVSVGKAEFNLR